MEAPASLLDTSSGSDAELEAPCSRAAAAARPRLSPPLPRWPQPQRRSRLLAVARQLAGALAAAAAVALLVAVAAGRGNAAPPGRVAGAVGLAGEAEGASGQGGIATAARLCTDGWAFTFTTSVQVDFAQGVFSVLTSSSDALNLTVSAQAGQAPVIILRMATYNHGSVQVKSRVLQIGVLYNVTVRKERDELCLEVRGGLSTESAAAPACVFPGGEIPTTGFQMRAPGKLALGVPTPGTGLQVRGFAQTQGMVPISFELSGVPFSRLYQDDTAWASLVGSMAEMLATVAKNDVLPQHVTVSPAGPGEVADSTLFMGSVMPAHGGAAGAACEVQDALAASLGRAAGGIRATYFAAAAETLAATAGQAGAQLSRAQVPGEPLLCSLSSCRLSEYLPLPAGARCLGGGCEATCCQIAWSATPLPQPKDGGASPKLAASPAQAPAANVPARPEFHRVDFASVHLPPPEAPGSAVLDRVQKLLQEEKSLVAKVEEWEMLGKALPKGKQEVVPLASDGFSFQFKLNVSIMAFVGEQQLIRSDLDAIQLVFRSLGPLMGVAVFAAKLLNPLWLGGSTGGCQVTSKPLLAPSMYEVTLTRDAGQCCLEVASAKGGLPSKKSCAQRLPAVSAAHWQTRPVQHLALTSAIAAAPISGSFSQQAGSLTASFYLAGLDYHLLTGTCACVDGVKQAVKEAIVFGLASDHQVSVFLKASQYTAVPQGAQAARVISMPAITEELLAAQAAAESKLQALMQSHLEANATRSASAVPPGVQPTARRLSLPGPPPPPPPSSVPGASAAERALEDAPPAVPGQPAAQVAVQVQVTVHGCGACAAEAAALQADGLGQAVAARVLMVAGAAAAGGTVTLQGLEVPANPSTCEHFACPAYMVPVGPGKLCYGGDCEAACCKPATCAEQACQAPLVPNLLNALKTCKNETDCADTCCLLPCKSYQCQGEVCPKAQRWMLLSKPSEAQDTCCEKMDCCDAPIAFCISCRKCQTLQAYCASWLTRWLPVAAAQRRLGAAWHEEGEGSQEPVPAASSSPPGPQRGLAAASRPARKADGRESHHQSAKQNATLAGMVADIEQAAAFASASKLEKRLGMQQDADWKSRWDRAVMEAKAPSFGLVAGCEGVRAAPCRYSFSTMFMLHRGFGAAPQAVNAVGILTDTTNAVTCGADARCWVWDIASGDPRMVFIDHTGPVNTVSILWDSTYILSAGTDQDGKGEAFVWWWEKGMQAGTIACPAPFLASAPMPAWRLALAGCQSNFTYMWNWDAGKSFQLPWYARTRAQVEAALKAQLQSFQQQTLNGMQRLALSKFKDKKAQMQAMLDKLFPEQAAIKANVSDRFTNFFNLIHSNRMGAVNAVAYVPTNLRFASGHADGRVRYWNADSGVLLNTMGSHQGPVMSIVASPKRQQAFSGGQDGTIRLWDLEAGTQLLLLYQAYGGPVRSLAMIPGGTKLVAGSDDGFVRIWDITSGLLQCQFPTLGGPVRGLAVNPSNPLGQIITANADGYARVFNPQVEGQA